MVSLRLDLIPWAGVRAEIGLAQMPGFQHLARRSLQHHAAAFDHVRVLGDRERLRHVLLDEQHRHALIADPPHHREQLVEQLRREAERRLVEHEQSRPRHERAPDREHLLFAAAHRPGELIAPLLEPCEEAKHLAHPRLALVARGEIAAELEVLAHRHLRKELPPLGHEREPLRHDRRRRGRQRRVVEQHLALVRDEPGQRPQQRRLAGAVRSHDHGKLARRHLQVDGIEHADRAVARRKPAHEELGAHAVASAPR